MQSGFNNVLISPRLLKSQTFKDFLKKPISRSIILRHDVDLLPKNSLEFARIQHRRGVKGVYYFRAVKESWDESIIKEIHELGHEIGYHYENLTVCKGNYEDAINDFKNNLNKLRKFEIYNYAFWCT